MLTYLAIDNLALMEHCEAEFAPGFNVVTGETGAGKSVLLGAVSLLLGGRADKSMIRTGAARCEVCGIFRPDAPVMAEIVPLLEEAGIPPCEEGELHLRRVLTASSGRCYLNDSAVTVHLLQKIASILVDVHMANEHQSLVSPQVQLELLDRFAGTEELRRKCGEICARKRTLEAKQAEFERAMPTAAEAAHFQAVAEEIRRIAPVPGEDEELAARLALVSGSRQVKNDTAFAASILTEGENPVADRLSLVYRQLQHLAELGGKEGAELLERCGLLSENVQSLSADIVSYGERVELDAEALANLESRLSDLYTLKRRYGADLKQVLKTAEDAERRADDYRRGDEKRAVFRQEGEALRKELAACAGELSARRKEAAAHFAEETGKKLAVLGFASGKLQPEWSETEPGADGMDRFEWLFAPNPGEEYRPLRKIASSGELSRVMLALKTVLADADRIPVSVFDEIDVNIGGETAARVGEELCRLGKTRQILSISHLAQVALQAEKHFVVTKSSDSGRTVSRVAVADGEARVLEIARMLGGGKAAGIHAASLLAKRKSKA